MLGERNFRRFYLGYLTSRLGSQMSAVAIAFAVLGSGGSAADLGYVFAAGVVPQVFLMISGGVLADRIGRRPVMLGADAGRFAVQATLAAFLFTGRPGTAVFVICAALVSTGEAFFMPLLDALTTEIAPPGQLSDANALTSVARSAAMVVGPALSGVLVAAFGPAVVIAVDAASYGASVASLALLDLPPMRPGRQSPLRDLAEGWAQFRSQPWLGATTIWYALFNLFTWAPYLLLGPVLARQYMGGAGAWGVIVSAYAAGAIVAGALVLGRRPRRLVATAMLGTFGFAVPCLLLAVHAPAAAVAVGAAAAGAGSAVSGTFTSTATQQRIEPGALARVGAITVTAAFALGSFGFAVIGPLSSVISPRILLGFGAAWSFTTSAIVLALPAVRAVTWRPADQPASAKGDESID